MHLLSASLEVLNKITEFTLFFKTYYFGFLFFPSIMDSEILKVVWGLWETSSHLCMHLKLLKWKKTTNLHFKKVV